nr:transglutaminase-like domain-containing protein [uncultured Eisenbergiella sp.]
MVSARFQEYALKKYAEREGFYAPLREELENGFSGCTGDEAVCMKFLYGTMPVRDAGEYGFSTFLGFVRHSLWLREHVKWCRDLPEDIFADYVLSYRVNNEGISDCRAFFYSRIRDRIDGLDPEEAVKEINYWCAENAAYEASDERTASPLTVYRSGKGRCGEESVFAVTAYRSAGIPARQIYTPRWAHCDDNHAWVEVYIRGTWYFLGACEPEEVLNKGWFAAPAGRAILIHSRAFSDFSAVTAQENPGRDGGRERGEILGKDGAAVYYNNTPAYTGTCRLGITVTEEQGRPCGYAGVAVEILNMAEYYPAAVLTADGQGRAEITVGRGTVRVRAWKDGRFAEALAALPEETELRLVPKRSAEEKGWASDRWEQEEWTPPQEYPMHPGTQTEEQKRRKEQRSAEAAVSRERRFAAYYKEEIAAQYPEEAYMLRLAGENFEELHAFLNQDGRADRKRLLHSLSAKDYKDLKKEILEDHLLCERGDWPEEIYVQYLLCPRIGREELTAWRRFIRAYFTEDEKREFRENPIRIRHYIQENIRYEPGLDYASLCATPIGCLKLGHGNPEARKILFTAICRSLGIPARLNRASGEAEYWSGDAFAEIVWTKDRMGNALGNRAGMHTENDAGNETGGENGNGARNNRPALVLTAEDGSRWKYYHNWTIGRLEGTGFRTMDYEGCRLEGNSLRLDLGKGIYRLLTVRRRTDGSQCVLRRTFALEAGEEKHIMLEYPEDANGGALRRVPLQDFTLKEESGKSAMLSTLTADGAAALAFLGPGEEPTEHVLNELLECAARWNKSGPVLAVILRSREALENRTLQKVLDSIPGTRVYVAGQEEREKAAESMGVDGEKLPVLILAESGPSGIYACAGYHVGSVELMLEITQRRKKAGCPGKPEGHQTNSTAIKE